MKVIKNTDTNVVAEIERKLKENDGYCPCRISKTKANKCMCAEFREQIKNHQEGECHCGLYLAIDE